MSDSQPKINFASNPMYSFYGLWCDCAQNKDALNGFDDDRLSKIANVAPQKGSKMRSIIGKIHEFNITDITGLKSLIKDKLDTQTLEILESAFEAYKEFYAKNKKNIDNNLIVMDTEQQTYQRELAKLYKCFDISPETICSCYLNPFPKNKINDGISNNKSVSMDYSLNKTEDANNYVSNSDILKRKLSTPFHEATHFLFNNSQLKKDIEEEKYPQINSVLNQVISKFEKKGNGTASRDEIKPFAIGAINEAFAACSSALYNEKTTGKPVTNDNEWYHGWKEASDLAKQMYPLFKKYLNEGKSFDCQFFAKLSSAIKIDELRNSNKLQPQEKTSSDKILGLRGLDAVPQTRTPDRSSQSLSKANSNIIKYIQDSKQNA